MNADALLKLLDVGALLAIMGITEGIKKMLPESAWRWLPVVPLVLGVGAGVIFTENVDQWRALAKSALYYGGGASIAYELLRTTILGKGAKAELK